jgi:hypothetical protein
LKTFRFDRIDVLLVGLLLGCVGAFLLVRGTPPGCPDFHARLGLAGDAGRANKILQECGLTPSAITMALGVDSAFAVAYGLVLAWALWRWWPMAWRTTFLLRLRLIWLAPLAAMVFDLAENLTLWLSLRERLTLSHLVAQVVFVFAWWKFACAAIAVVAVVLAAIGSFGYHTTPRLLHNQEPDQGDQERNRSTDGTGICLSGGGIRAASFTLGGLQGLDTGKSFRSAKFLSAVSGGAYTAVAWCIARERQGSAHAAHPRPTEDSDGLLLPEPNDHSLYQYIRANRRHLATGRGGIPSAVLIAVGFLAVNLFLLGLLLYLVSWPIGRLVSSDAVLPSLADCQYGAACTAEPTWRLALPGLFAAGAAAVALFFSLFLRGNSHANLVKVAGGLVLAAVMFLVVLVAIPAAIANIPWWLHELIGARAVPEVTGLVSVLASLGVGGALLRLVFKPLSRAAPRLGGALLGVVAVLLAGKFATDAAYSHGTLSKPWTFLIAGIVFASLYWILNQRLWSLHTLYLLRLRSTFSTKQEHGSRSVAGIRPRPFREEGTWADYAKRDNELDHSLPEVLVCAAAQRQDRTSTGIPAVSFVFSPKEIVLTDTHPQEDGRIEVKRHAVTADIYARSTARRLVTPSGAAAMSGAAFTSAMGRHSLGSTNALLAALNLRLGVWMPNPMHVSSYRNNVRKFKPPRLSYLVKEILGVYDLNDVYVYVTDGGHWENLGLVELIRRRCKWIFCIDASGDKPGSFTTLREAITLARVECNATVAINCDRLAPDPSSGMAKDCVAVGHIQYHANPDDTPDMQCSSLTCPTGVLFYIKAVVSPYAPLAVQAYALEDRRFPRYSTGDQFLSQPQFDRLVALGRSGALRAVKLRKELTTALEQKGLPQEEPALAEAYCRLQALKFQPSPELVTTAEDRAAAAADAGEAVGEAH